MQKEPEEETHESLVHAGFMLMFGMSFGELCVLVIVGVVIFGPKDLPRVLRGAGKFAGKLRRLASDVRAESGIDEMLRSEGLHKDIAEIRRLARGDFNPPLLRPERPPSSRVAADPLCATENISAALFFPEPSRELAEPFPEAATVAGEHGLLVATPIEDGARALGTPRRVGQA
jgi:Tat protein translocase TatB subunit